MLRVTNYAGTDDVRLVFPGARPVSVRPVQLPGQSNYFKGNDPAKWRRNVAHYAPVRYSSLYPGIDAVFYGKGRVLEYDFVVHPGADASLIRLNLEGADRDRVELLDDGALRAEIDGALIVQHRPQVYQLIEGKRHSIESEYVRTASGFGVRVAEYDRERDLVIDPTFQFSSFLGGNEDPNSGERVSALAVGTDRGVFLAGET